MTLKIVEKQFSYNFMQKYPKKFPRIILTFTLGQKCEKPFRKVLIFERNCIRSLKWKKESNYQTLKFNQKDKFS